MHCTDVLPTGNIEPDPGVQDTVTGAWPPLPVGAAKVTAMPAADVVVTETGAGHDNVGEPGVGVGVGVGVGFGVGDVGLLVLHAAETTSATATR